MLRARIHTFWEKYERYLSVLAFVGGFILDNLTLRRIDLWIENIVLTSYLAIAALGIIIYNAYEGPLQEGGAHGRLHGRFGQRMARWMPLVIQFAFGALFSGFFVFYSRSASLATSWPFILFLLALLFGNEIFKRRYAFFTFQLMVFFIAAFSYAIFLVPVVLHRMGVIPFLLSGLLGFAVLWLVLRVLSFLAPVRYQGSRRMLRVAVTAIYLTFNILYFGNIIPPIPLALKEIGIYHSVKRSPSGNYEVEYEPVRWYEFGKRFNPVFHRAGNESVYVFSAIFAPTKLNVPVFHIWSYFNENEGKWIESSRVQFTISGGRDGGYRGYSFKSSVVPGQWRVDVATERGQLIGRTTFTVISAANPVPVETRMR